MTRGKLSISDITPYHLQHEKIGPRISEAYKKLRLEKSSIDCYIMLKLGKAQPSIRDFENYLRFLVDFDEDDIQLILKQNNSIFFTYELAPGIYTIKVISKAVYTMGDHEELYKFNLMILA